jgi:hypothetical protein
VGVTARLAGLGRRFAARSAAAALRFADGFASARIAGFGSGSSAVATQ